MDKLRPIGLYDSGVGGLSVVREVFRQMPLERVIYFGDTARVPYGPRKPGELLTFNREIVSYLMAQGVKLILVACNTSCAVALPALRQEFSVPILGLIDAGAQAAVENGRRIGVIATQATIKSRAYERSIHQISEESEVFGLACPNLVPLVEGGIWRGNEAFDVVKKELEPLKDLNLDTLVLGCTHFPHLAPVIAQVMGPNVKLVDPARHAVAHLRRALTKHRLLSPGSHQDHRFIVSGDPDSFHTLANRLFADCQVEAVSMDMPFLHTA